MLNIIKPHRLNEQYIFLLLFFYVTDVVAFANNVSMLCGGIYSPYIYIVFKNAVSILLPFFYIYVYVLSYFNITATNRYFRISGDFVPFLNGTVINNYFKIKHP